MAVRPSSDSEIALSRIASCLEAKMSLPQEQEKDPVGKPGEDPKPPRPPGNNDPEPDVPDENDDLGDLLRPVIA